MKITTRVAVGIVALGAFSLPAAAASADPAWCGEVVTVPGTVITLTDDLHCDGTALTVAADNVTIDLAGFTIKGSATEPSSHHRPYPDPRFDGYVAGVHVIGAAHTRITGGTIDGFDAGVVADNATNVLGDSLAIRDFSGWGIWATETNGLTVSGATISGTWTVGTDVPVTEFGLVDAGINAFNSTAVRVEDSTISLVPGQGIFADNVGGLEVLNTVVTNNFGDGIGFSRPPNGTSVVLDTVSTSKNGQAGIIANLTTGAHVSLRNVDASHNALVGVWLYSGWDVDTGARQPFEAMISNSVASANGTDSGFALTGSGTWRLTNNTASDNQGEGFYADGGRLISSGNVAKGNHSDGFLLAQGITGSSTSDVATGNLGSGVALDNNPTRETDNVVTLTGLKVSGNEAYGLLVKTGTANVTGGAFNANSLDGIRVLNHAAAYLAEAKANKNGGNGFAFIAGSRGSGSKLTATHNRRYGLCYEAGASFTKYPPNFLHFNAAGAWSHNCQGYIFPVPRF